MADEMTLGQFSKASQKLAKNMLYSAFDSTEYVKSVAAQSDGDHDLEQHKQKITQLGGETEQILKQQVYNNYLQFIETAKEISNLEDEMKQINQILSKQRGVMDKMSKVLVTDSGVDMDAKMKEQEAEKEIAMKEEQQQKALSTIIEKVEDCDPNLIKQGRSLVFEGRVAELNAENFQAFQEAHLFLLNDALLIATHESIYNQTDTLRRARRPTGTSEVEEYRRFKFDQIYSLKDIAIVNARDIGPMRNSFKILNFPDQRVFQCSDNKEKRSWLDVLDSTKRRFMTLEEEAKQQQLDGDALNRGVSAVRSMMTSMKAIRTAGAAAGLSPTHSDPYSPTCDDTGSHMGDGTKLDIAWLQDAIEEFDVFVAQRQFRDACDLITRGVEYLRGIRGQVDREEFKEWGLQFSKRRTELVQVLRNELQVQSTARMQRLPAELLVQLYDSRKSIQLFLKARSRTIRSLKPHTGSALQHIQRLSSQTFSMMAETIRDFQEIYQDCPQMNSLLITYFIQPEIDNFCEQFKYTVFSSGRSRLTFQEASECFDITLSEYEKRIDSIDMIFYVGQALRQEVVESIKLESRNVIQFFNSRLREENWQLIKDVEKTKELLAKYGIASGDLVDYLTDDESAIEIAACCVVLTRQLGIFVDGTCKFLDVETTRVAQQWVVDVWKSVLQQLKSVYRSLDEGSEERRIGKRSYEFLKDIILPKFTDSLCEFGFDGNLLYF